MYRGGRTAACDLSTDPDRLASCIAMVRCAAACHLRPKRCVAPYISPSKPRKALEPRSSLVPSLTDTQLVSSLHRLTMLVLNEKDVYAPSSAPRSVVRNETPLDTEHTLMTASSRRIRKSSRTPLHTLDQVPHRPLDTVRIYPTQKTYLTLGTILQHLAWPVFFFFPSIRGGSHVAGCKAAYNICLVNAHDARDSS